MWKKWYDEIMSTVKQKSKQRGLASYAGQWVALKGTRVIESAHSLRELMQKLKKNPLSQKASVMLVPRQDEGPYIL